MHNCGHLRTTNRHTDVSEMKWAEIAISFGFNYIYSCFGITTQTATYIIIQANSPDWLAFSPTICSCFLLGFKLYFSSIYSTYFYLFAISASRAFKACSNIAIFCFSEFTVSGNVYSTSTPPTTFQHLRSPCNGYTLVSTRLFYLRSSSSYTYLFSIS